MIQARNVTKRDGHKMAVDDIGFTVAPGKVTGFLGPNGAGKSTTMRMTVGLDRPTAGRGDYLPIACSPPACAPPGERRTGAT